MILNFKGRCKCKQLVLIKVVSQKARYVSVAKTSCLMMFREIISGSSENNTKYVNRRRDKNAVFEL
jgi:hypothetical protein